MSLDDPTVVALLAAEALGRAGIVRALYGGLDASGLIRLDLVEPRSIDYAHNALARALRSTLRGQPIRLLTPEDFVVFKILSTRKQDLIDAESMLSRLGAAKAPHDA
jgi:hypothetical protein